MKIKVNHILFFLLLFVTSVLFDACTKKDNTNTPSPLVYNISASDKAKILSHYLIVAYSPLRI